MSTPHAWLPAPSRPRAAIPAGDLAIGVAMGASLCALAMIVSANLQREAPPPPEEPITVSIGVLAASDAPAGGGGSPGRTGKPGKRRARANATPQSSEATAAEVPAQPHHAASGHPTQPISVPNPADGPMGLPSLGDLGEPSEGPAEGDEGGEGGEGGEDGGGGGDGGLGAYRSQLASWLAGHFHVEGSGLGQTALRKLRVRAVLELGDDRMVTGYRLTATGTPAVDEAATRALEAVKGQPIPTPPPSLGNLQRTIHVVLTCRPDTCD